MEPNDYWDDIKFCLDYPRYLNLWETDFLVQLSGFKEISDKQTDKLEKIIRKVELQLKLRRRARR